jgi:hypothetical protein
MSRTLNLRKLNNDVATIQRNLVGYPFSVSSLITVSGRPR